MVRKYLYQCIDPDPVQCLFCYMPIWHFLVYLLVSPVPPKKNLSSWISYWTRFALPHPQQAKTPWDAKVCRKERAWFKRQPSAETGNRLRWMSLKTKGRDIYVMEYKAAGWSEAWGRWGALGKLIGKTCSNCHPVQGWPVYWPLTSQGYQAGHSRMPIWRVGGPNHNPNQLSSN